MCNVLFCNPVATKVQGFATSDTSMFEERPYGSLLRDTVFIYCLYSERNLFGFKSPRSQCIRSILDLNHLHGILVAYYANQQKQLNNYLS